MYNSDICVKNNNAQIKKENIKSDLQETYLTTHITMQVNNIA